MNFDWTEATLSVQAMINGFIERTPYFSVALVVFVLFVMIGRGLRAAIRAINKRNRKHYNIGLVLGRLGYGLMIFIGLLIALVIAIPGFTPGQLVNLLGLSSVAIGFAFRDILQNFLAGIMILIAQPFRLGDQIVSGEFEGTVEEIETRATFIRTYDGRRIVIPNAKLFTEPFVVNTANDKRRMQYDIGIGYGDDIALAKRIMLETVGGVPEVLRDPPPDVLLVDFSGSSINLRLRWWVRPPRQFDALNALDSVLEKVRAALGNAGIDLPFPTRQILFHDQTEESDGDRRRQREGWPRRNGEAPRPARIADALLALRGTGHGSGDSGRHRDAAAPPPGKRS